MRKVPLALLAASAFVPFTLHRLPSADLWWALADGRLIWQTGRIPQTDPFSYTAHGLPWHNDQWLVAWLFFGLFQAGGLAALQLTKTLLLALTFALAVSQAASRAQSSAWAALLAGLFSMAFSEHASFFDVRAYLFSYLNLMLLWTALQRRWPVWLLPPLFALWVNEHAAVTGGLVLLFLWTLGARTRPLALASLGCLAATLLNPGGYHILLHAFRLTGSQWGRYLNEWQPILGKSEFLPYLVFLTVTLILTLRLPLLASERLVLVAFGLLSLTGWRHVPLFCWLAITPWAMAQRRLPELPRAVYAPAAGLALGLAALTLARTPLAELSLENRLFPRWACDFLEANHLGGRLFHPYGFGGYLLWRLSPASTVAIDGRAAQVYPVEVYLEYLRAARDPQQLSEFAKRHGVETVITFRDPAMLEGTQAPSGWTRIYSDDLCEVFRSSTPPSLVHPPSPPGLVEQARQALAAGGDPRALLNRALQLEPDYAPALFLYGTTFLRAGSPQGVEYLERAARVAPGLQGVHLNLAIWFSDKDRERSRREAEAELRLNPANAQARQLLR